MNPERKFSFLVLFVLILLSGCVKPEDEFEDMPALNRPEVQGRLILGRKLEDPYAIHNIRKAFNSLKLARGETPVDEIKANYIYLRFLPRNDEEWAILQNDSSLILYDYPLDYEITQNGDSYHDPSLPDSTITWQYCVIPVNKKISYIKHEIIYEVFIPSEAQSSGKNLSAQTGQFYQDLEIESARITGNFTKDDEYADEAKGSKWTPKGTINVWDDVLERYIPLAQVSVHARWFTHIETDLTDENGYFQTSSFRNKVNYSIKWERSYYSIRNGMFLQAWYNGPKMKGDWNLDIKGGESMMYATIHRAAYKHFYGDNLGMLRPILKNGNKTKICYRDSYGKGVYWGNWSAGLFPDIQVWGKTRGRYKPTNQIFGTTTHELGHQSHAQYVGDLKFWGTSKIIYESWADAVEWSLSNDEYQKLGQKYGVTAAMHYNHHYNTHNRWPTVVDKDYSPIFIDLMDHINQRVFFGQTYPNDLITGYSLSLINSTLLENSSGLKSLKEEIIKHKPENVDDYQVQELFELY